MNERELIGKVVLVDFSYFDEFESSLGYLQFHGKIVAADAKTGIVVHDDEKNEDHVLPPRFDALFLAPPGSYRQSERGVVIENPDFLSKWHIKKIPGDNDSWEWHPYRLDLPLGELPDTEDATSEQTCVGDGVNTKELASSGESGGGATTAEPDWRLQGQETYLKGVTLVRRLYRRYSKNPAWDHDHCEFCWRAFAVEDLPDALHGGYSTEDEYRWICEQCFEDFHEKFEWTVIEEIT